MSQDKPEVQEFVTLRIPVEKYDFLHKTIRSFQESLYSWHLDRFISKKLITDLRIMKSVLETNKLKENPHERLRYDATAVALADSPASH
jgi:hypothetical protein